MGILPAGDRASEPTCINPPLGFTKGREWFGWNDNANSLTRCWHYHTPVDSQRTMIRPIKVIDMDRRTPIALISPTPLDTKDDQKNAQDVIGRVLDQPLCNTNNVL